MVIPACSLHVIFFFFFIFNESNCPLRSCDLTSLDASILYPIIFKLLLRNCYIKKVESSRMIGVSERKILLMRLHGFWTGERDSPLNALY